MDLYYGYYGYYGYSGLTKPMEATESVNELSKELVVKEKELAIASKEAEVVLADVAVKAASAEKVCLSPCNAAIVLCWYCSSSMLVLR